MNRTACLAMVSLLLSLTLVGCGSPTTMVPTPSLYASEPGDPFADVPPAWRSLRSTILYATDRRGEPDEEGVLRYGFKRSHQLTLGTCVVEHQGVKDWDQLVALSRVEHRPTQVNCRVVEIKPLATMADSGKGPHLKDGKVAPDPQDVEMNRQAVAALHEALAAQLAHTPRKEVFIYIHGFNNSFEVGTVRIAQLWHFLGRTGVPIVYSWPAGAQGLLRGYTHDRESSEFTIFHAKQFLRAVADCPQVERVHLIAHSRGTDVATSALRELHLEMGGQPEVTRQRLKLGHAVLAAPDLDLEVAIQRISAERLGLVPQYTTVYLNARDKAIGIADWLYESARRVGRLLVSDLSQQQRDAFDRLSTIGFVNVNVRTDTLGHGYFISHPLVLSDLLLLLRDNKRPGAENGRPLIDCPGAFWELNEGYSQALRAKSAPAAESASGD